MTRSRLSVITLGVDDLTVARRFYVDGLGWEPTLDVPGEVAFIQVAPGVLLALWRREAMAADAGVPVTAGDAVELAHNVDSEPEVTAFLERAAAAGATIVKPAARASWGGFHGLFIDPSGFRWEVAHNPGLVVDPDGTVRFTSN